MTAADGEPGAVVDLAALARTSADRGPVWTRQSVDLNLNLMVFEGGAGVAEHQNGEVDVLVVGIEGAGRVTVDGRRLLLQAGQALLIPRGTRRAIASAGGRFAYLTCHRQRAGLWPSNVPRPTLGSDEGENRR